jgi:hypothetical protein
MGRPRPCSVHRILVVLSAYLVIHLDLQIGKLCRLQRARSPFRRERLTKTRSLAKWSVLIPTIGMAAFGEEEERSASQQAHSS